MSFRVVRLLRQAFLLMAVCILSILGVRVYDALSGPPLDVWNTYVPHELSPARLDQSNWADYLKAEDEIFEGVRREVTEKLTPAQRRQSNRYFEGSPMFPGHYARDWNRSFVLEPASEPVGAAVFLHGLTDSPYSLRHLAESYQERGYIAVGLSTSDVGLNTAANQFRSLAKMSESGASVWRVVSE